MEKNEELTEQNKPETLRILNLLYFSLCSVLIALVFLPCRVLASHIPPHPGELTAELPPHPLSSQKQNANFHTVLCLNFPLTSWNRQRTVPSLVVHTFAAWHESESESCLPPVCSEHKSKRHLSHSAWWATTGGGLAGLRLTHSAKIEIT